MIKIYHQLGHNDNWNMDSFQNEKKGDGFILAPRFREEQHIRTLDAEIRQKSIFDPQFYIPSVSRGCLESYSFFPAQVVLPSDFVTIDYTNSHLEYEAASKCIDFQVDNNFEYVIIPSRYYEGIPSDYVDKLESQFVNPFIKELRKKALGAKTLLQIVINEHMVKNSAFMDTLLNWITSLYDISGIYLVYERPKSPKQIHDTDFLLSILHFIDVLVCNDFKVIVGYTNTEGILLSLANPTGLSIGSYENLRMFDHRNFEEKKESSPRGPSPRLYMSKLMHWIDFNYLGAIKSAMKNDVLFDSTTHQIDLFKLTKKWHFTNPSLYKHYFFVYVDQIKNIYKFHGKERYIEVSRLLNDAIGKYSLLDKEGVIFDEESRGTHLYTWLSVANIFAKNKGWR